MRTRPTSPIATLSCASFTPVFIQSFVDLSRPQLQTRQRTCTYRHVRLNRRYGVKQPRSTYAARGNQHSNLPGKQLKPTEASTAHDATIPSHLTAKVVVPTTRPT